MMVLLISLLFGLSAMLNAVMDKLETEISFKASVFSGLDPDFWCKPVSAHRADFLPWTTYRLDAWHLCKSIMVVLIACCVWMAGLIELPFDGLVRFFVVLGWAGIVWNGSFNFFYNLFTR